MSSFNNLKGAPYEFSPTFACEQGVINLYGSFQGNTTSQPTISQFRGSWFTATRVTTGQYRVTLNGLNVPTTLVATVPTTQGNGQPNGLLEESIAWIVSEQLQTSPHVYTCVTSKFDGSDATTPTLSQSFDIFITQAQMPTTTTAGTVIANAAVDPATTDRVCFELAWKVLAPTP